MKPKLVIVGYLNIDENNTPAGRTVLPGGAVYFASLAASLFIQPVGLVSRIGDDFDTTFLFNHVLSNAVTVDKDKKTTRSIQTYYSLKDLSKRDLEVIPGAAQDLHPEDIPAEWITKGSFFHVGTMLPDHQQTFVAYLAKKEKRPYISIDTDISFLHGDKYRSIIESNFMACDLVFMNRKEYESLSYLIPRLKEVVVKLDKDGALYIRKGKIEEKVLAQQVDAVEVTGAGDVFAGVFMANKARGKSIKACLEMACDEATKSVVKNGIEHLFS